MQFKSNMPALFMIILGLVFALTLGAPLEPQPPELPWYVSRAAEQVSEDQGIVFEVDPETADQEVVRSVIRNNRESSIFFGEPYRLQVDVAGDWYDIVVPEPVFIDILYSLDPGESMALQFNLRPVYGVNPDGRLIDASYRLVKAVWLTAPETGAATESVMVTAPFQIAP